MFIRLINNIFVIYFPMFNNVLYWIEDYDFNTGKASYNYLLKSDNLSYWVHKHFKGAVLNFIHFRQHSLHYNYPQSFQTTQMQILFGNFSSGCLLCSAFKILLFRSLRRRLVIWTIEPNLNSNWWIPRAGIWFSSPAQPLENFLFKRQIRRKPFVYCPGNRSAISTQHDLLFQR